jgi:NADH-quinone oxidoreductase subunit L
MALIVTGVGSLIHVYSIGYMKDDTSYARYFAYLNLFPVLHAAAGARPVAPRALRRLGRRGLASYLLIGFWFEDPDKARAARRRSSPTGSATRASSSGCSCSIRRSARSTWTGSTRRS